MPEESKTDDAAVGFAALEGYTTAEKKFMEPTAGSERVYYLVIARELKGHE